MEVKNPVMKQFFYCTACEQDVYEVDPPFETGDEITPDRLRVIKPEWPLPSSSIDPACPNCGEIWGGGMIDPSNYSDEELNEEDS